MMIYYVNDYLDISTIVTISIIAQKKFQCISMYKYIV